MLIPVIKLTYEALGVINRILIPGDQEATVILAVDDLQGLLPGVSGKCFVINEDNNFTAVLYIHEVRIVSSTEGQIRVSLVTRLTAEQQAALADLWYDLR